MQKVTIDNDKCIRSRVCSARRVCPHGAILPLPGGAYPGAEGYTVDSKRCRGCAVCVRACSAGAVHILQEVQ